MSKPLVKGSSNHSLMLSKQKHTSIDLAYLKTPGHKLIKKGLEMHKIGNEIESAGFRKLAILKQLNKKTEKDLKILVERSNKSHSLKNFNSPYFDTKKTAKKQLRKNNTYTLRPVYQDVLKVLDPTGYADRHRVGKSRDYLSEFKKSRLERSKRLVSSQLLSNKGKESQLRFIADQCRLPMERRENSLLTELGDERSVLSLNVIVSPHRFRKHSASFLRRPVKSVSEQSKLI